MVGCNETTNGLGGLLYACTLHAHDVHTRTAGVHPLVELTQMAGECPQLGPNSCYASYMAFVYITHNGSSLRQRSDPGLQDMVASFANIHAELIPTW